MARRLHIIVGIGGDWNKPLLLKTDAYKEQYNHVCLCENFHCSKRTWMDM